MSRRGDPAARIQSARDRRKSYQIAYALTSEAVPALLIATATGLVVGKGELFGDGIAPALAGFIAQNYEIEKTLLLALSS